MMLGTEILQWLTEADTQLLLAVNGFHAAFADGFMMGYTKVVVWVPLYVALVFMLMKNMTLKGGLTALACIGLTILLCDQVTSHLIRPMVLRLRPTNPDNPVSEWVHLVNGYRGGRYGFPSAHASNTFGLAFFLMYLFRNRVLTGLMMLWAFLNCYSRVYLGVHYPGDILAGFSIGVLSASFSYWIFSRWSRERPMFPVLFVWIPQLVWLVSVAGLCLYAACK